MDRTEILCAWFPAIIPYSQGEGLWNMCISIADDDEAFDMVYCLSDSEQDALAGEPWLEEKQEHADRYELMGKAMTLSAKDKKQICGADSCDDGGLVTGGHTQQLRPRRRGADSILAL